MTPSVKKLYTELRDKRKFVPAQTIVSKPSYKTIIVKRDGQVVRRILK